jgi:hypothetical protein
MSRSPSQPVRWLSYRPFALERGIAHSAVFNIDYYITHTEEMTGEANRLGLEPIVIEEAYSIFRLPDSDPIEVARYAPMVFAGEEDFVDMAVEWYDDLDNLEHWVAADGPEEWRKFYDIEGPFDGGAPLNTDGAVVSDVLIENHNISFKTSAVGVPHLVKTSYFPNWQATGADGPYRATPSLMIVIPTQENVSLEFGRTWAENVGRMLTFLAFVFVGWWVLRHRRRYLETIADDGV